jgi:Mg-chelatase subunit ChlD
MNLVVGEPRAWTLLLLIPLLALIWWRSKVYMTLRSRLILLGLRSLAILLFIVALADLRLPRFQRGTGQGVAVVLDVSDSLGQDTAEEMTQALADSWRSWSNSLGPGGKLSLAMLGRDLVPVPAELLKGPSAPDSERLLEVVQEARKGTGKRFTTLPAALAYARDAFSVGDATRLVLASDGRSNQGDLEEELLAAKLAGLKISPLPLMPLEEDPLYIESFRGPAQVFSGDEYSVSARLHSEQPGSVRLVLRQQGTIILRRTLRLTPGVTTWSHKLQAGATGSVSLELAIEPIDLPDRHPENNLYSAFTQVRQVPEILFATAQPSPHLALLGALKAAHLKVQMKRFSALPEQAAGLNRYSAVILDSPAAKELSPAQQDTLLRYVKVKGGGLLMIGGKNTLARGTWLRDHLEEALPVHLVPSTQTASFALYLLLDSSSSMSGPPMAQAKFAAKRIISLMSGRILGVAHFAHDVTVAVPLQVVGENKILVAKDIDKIQANGGTAFTPGLNLAIQELKQEGASENHILLLSDGQPGDEFMVRQLYPVLNQNQIKVSTVGIGLSVNARLLEEIARACNGRYYGVNDLTDLVEIFEKEVERLIGPPYEEASFIPDVDRLHFLARSLPKTGMPELHGYLGTTLKPGAEAPLINGFGDPILAVWQCGLGKSAVWASDVHGPWGKDWRRWKTGFIPFWEAVIKSIVRSEISDFKLGLQLRGREVAVVVDAVDREGHFLNGEKLSLGIKPPEGKPYGIPLQQTEEGRYQGRFFAEQRGFYAVRLKKDEGGLAKEVNKGGIALGYDPEYHPEVDGLPLLQRLATATGGTMLGDMEDVGLLIQEKVESQNKEVLRFWLPFAVLGLLVFFLEVALRRLGWFHISNLNQLEGGADQGSLAYQHIAERYLKMAVNLDQAGDKEQAQRYYLKARSFFLKANAEEKASRTWEKYRQTERR